MRRMTFVQRKIIYSAGIVLAYLVGRNISIPWVQQETSAPASNDLATVITNSILGKTENSSSILALGFGPWMTAMIIVTIIRSFLPGEKKRQADLWTQRWILALTVPTAIIQAYIRVAGMEMKDSWAGRPVLCRALTALILVTGSFVGLWLIDRNQKKGIGGTSLLVLVNILDSLRTTISPYIIRFIGGEAARAGRHYLYVAAAVYMLLVIFFIILFQRSEIRIPVNRVMIHNVYADKDYIAIGLNPAGTMPMMFALTVFMIPSYVLRLLSLLIPSAGEKLTAMAGWFSLGSLHGIILYLVIMAALTFVFAHVNIDSEEIAEGFEKSGDDIPGIRPGEETASFLERQVLFCIIVSIVMMGVGIGIPLAAGAILGLSGQVMLLPATIMIMTGLVLQILEEYETMKTFEYYQPFL